MKIRFLLIVAFLSFCSSLLATNQKFKVEEVFSMDCGEGSGELGCRKVEIVVGTDGAVDPLTGSILPAGTKLFTLEHPRVRIKVDRSENIYLSDEFKSRVLCYNVKARSMHWEKIQRSAHNTVLVPDKGEAGALLKDDKEYSMKSERRALKVSRSGNGYVYSVRNIYGRKGCENISYSLDTLFILTSPSIKLSESRILMKGAERWKDPEKCYVNFLDFSNCESQLVELNELAGAGSTLDSFDYLNANLVYIASWRDRRLTITKITVQL